MVLYGLAKKEREQIITGGSSLAQPC